VRIYTLRIPTEILLRTRKDGKKKIFRLNTNNYRNTHYRDLHLSKKLYAESIIPSLKDLPKFKKIELEYRLYLTSRRRLDVNNVLAIVDKYFQDCLVEADVIEDDNYNFVARTLFLYGGHYPEEESNFVMVTIKGVELK
jgi:hypothetical protein